jgi:hypothetical protein
MLSLIPMALITRLTKTLALGKLVEKFGAWLFVCDYSSTSRNKEKHILQRSTWADTFKK